VVESYFYYFSEFFSIYFKESTYTN